MVGASFGGASLYEAQATTVARKEARTETPAEIFYKTSQKLLSRTVKAFKGQLKTTHCEKVNNTVLDAACFVKTTADNSEN